jgi:hypothetical protein
LRGATWPAAGVPLSSNYVGHASSDTDALVRAIIPRHAKEVEGSLDCLLVTPKR